MIYLNIAGGLGNQLFQYAYGRYLQELLNDNVTYLVSSYKSDELRELALDKFDIDKSWIQDSDTVYWDSHRLKKISYKIFKRLDEIFHFALTDNTPTKYYIEKQKRLQKHGLYVHEQHAYLMPNITCAKEKYADGLWHHPMYADKMIDALREELQLKSGIDLPAELQSDIEASESVCVHVRRGDYLNYNYYMVCNPAYYNECMLEIKKMHPQVKFFIFSDDIEWAKNNLNASEIAESVYVPQGNADYVDFELMRRCKHFIISNSTFSWWAAYLGEYKQKTVITPDKWYSDGRNKEWLNLDGWIVHSTKC